MYNVLESVLVYMVLYMDASIWAFLALQW